MSVRTVYAIMVSMPETVLESERANYLQFKDNYAPLVDQKKLFKAKLLAEEARRQGLKVALIFNYFVQDPYHGKPPHVSAQDGKIVRSETARAQGLGYLPFAWKEGWKYAMKVVEMYTKACEPDYIQQGVEHATMNWYREDEPLKPHWGYNDVMGMFAEGLKPTTWKGTYVVSAYYTNTLKKARDYFGAAIRDTDLLEMVTYELPGDIVPPEDDGDGDKGDVIGPPMPPIDISDFVTKGQFLEVTLKIAEMIDEIRGEINQIQVELSDIRDELDSNDAVLDRIVKVFGGWLL